MVVDVVSYVVGIVGVSFDYCDIFGKLKGNEVIVY